MSEWVVEGCGCCGFPENVFLEGKEWTSRMTATNVSCANEGGARALRLGEGRTGVEVKVDFPGIIEPPSLHRRGVWIGNLDFGDKYMIKIWNLYVFDISRYLKFVRECSIM